MTTTKNDDTTVKRRHIELDASDLGAFQERRRRQLEQERQRKAADDDCDDDSPGAA